MNRRSGDSIERLSVLVVTENFFEGLGIAPRLGRTFSGDEAAPERAPRVVVLSHSYWTVHFAADPGAIGQTLMLDGEPFVVVGVLPEEYRAVTGFMAPSALRSRERAHAADAERPRQLEPERARETPARRDA